MRCFATPPFLTCLYFQSDKEFIISDEWAHCIWKRVISHTSLTTDLDVRFKYTVSSMSTGKINHYICFIIILFIYTYVSYNHTLVTGLTINHTGPHGAHPYHVPQSHSLLCYSLQTDDRAGHWQTQHVIAWLIDPCCIYLWLLTCTCTCVVIWTSV